MFVGSVLYIRIGRIIITCDNYDIVSPHPHHYGPTLVITFYVRCRRRKKTRLHKYSWENEYNTHESYLVTPSVLYRFLQLSNLMGT